MKQFFKFMFASMVGTILLTGISSVIFIAILVSAIAGAQKESTPVKENSVIQMKLDQTIYDRTSSNPFENFNFNTMKSNSTPGLNDILSELKSAATDDKIKGIFLDVSDIPAGIATIEEIRNALLDFKKSGKFIIAYSEAYSQSAYYISTVADKIYINPEGLVIFKGLAAQLFFMKGLMEKIDVQPQIIRHGKYKSAIEPLISDKMSPANREQTSKYVQSIWDQMLKGISETRKIDIAVLNNIADSLLVTDAKDALKYKLVDGLKYKDEILDELKTRLALATDDKINFVSLSKYNKATKDENKKYSRNKIAIVYAQGDIVSGDGDDKTIGSESISEAIRKARMDSSVKAIVLRVNSPGGSALASEVIWREVSLAAKVKPVVASMGDLAASGGYYISCAATKIVASPNTITGSIGVFGVIPNMEKLFKNKLGITFDGVSTNKNSGYISVTRAMTPYEQVVLTNDIENIYGTFVKHVAEGRKMTEAQVDTIGQGRVWSGADAKNIGLIDDFGGLDKAIEIAAKLANLTEYKIVSYPEQKDPFIQLIEELSGDASASSILEKELGSNYIYYQYLKSASKMQGIQARMPYDVYIY
jgi:protease IV